ncbi:MAG: hypothetical protein ACFFBS_09460 [Promethearchaeota archaeon]
MNVFSEDSILFEAIDGKCLKRMRGIPHGIQRPWKELVSKGTLWAVYRISGEHWPRSTEKAILKLKESSGVSPCVLVGKNEDLGTVATAFSKLQVPVVTEIGGRGKLVRPRAVEKQKKVEKGWTSRVSPYVLEDCSKLNNIHADLRTLICVLVKKYGDKREWDDEHEHKALQTFFLDFAGLNGLSADASRAQIVLRRLEQAGMAGSRDHYFHSFQNFFFGLWVIGEARDYFEKWLKVSKLFWSVSLEFVWFLVCMWHDVGYGLHSRRAIEENVFGIELEESPTDRLSTYLTSLPIMEAKRTITSLMEHLLDTKPQTGWMEPRRESKYTNTEQKLERAIDADLRSGHGAASALRLYTDMMNFINKCAVQEKRNILIQSTLIAAASIPFHDWHFRRCVRKEYGVCKIPVITMPFAALLAYVDSIQEDRRKFDSIRKERAFLRHLTIEEERIISAEVDGAALANGDVIWKIVEATDVLSFLERSTASFEVEYPKWLVA